MPADPVVICGYARTPMGALQGVFAGVTAPALGAAAAAAAVSRATADPAAIDTIYMGCVLPAGLGQAPARQAGIGAGLPLDVQATTVNKMCGSGLQAVIMAADAIAAGSAGIVVAGGMESMTNAPYLLQKHRGGARLGHDTVSDSMFLDGLEDAYDRGKLMGAFADEAARAYQFSRADQDQFALRSLKRATDAIATGAFAAEITSVTTTGRGAPTVIDTDEQPGRARPDKIPTLRPAFAADGTVTAANASSISDGAAALVLTRAATAARQNMPILARIVAHAGHAQAPGLFTSAPVPAIRKVLDRAGWTVADVDLFEINEAFAVVPMIAARELGIPGARLNIHGGATALGHPIGASGARILATLLSALHQRGLRRGIASLCIGGGEALAMAVELA